MMRKLIRLSCFPLIILVFMAACSGSKDSPEAQVKAVMESMEGAIEARNNSALFEHISQRYKDHKGNDRDALRKFAQFYMLRNKNIEMFTRIQSLEQLDAATFAVEASVIMGAQADSRGAGLGQLRADSHDISAVFELQDDEWKLVSVSWPEQRAY